MNTLNVGQLATMFVAKKIPKTTVPSKTSNAIQNATAMMVLQGISMEFVFLQISVQVSRNSIIYLLYFLIF